MSCAAAAATGEAGEAAAAGEAADERVIASDATGVAATSARSAFCFEDSSRRRNRRRCSSAALVPCRAERTSPSPTALFEALIV